MSDSTPSSAGKGLPPTGFTPTERAADMDGSQTIAKIDGELRDMAGIKRPRLVSPLVATYTDERKPVSELHFALDTWTGDEWVRECDLTPGGTS